MDAVGIRAALGTHMHRLYSLVLVSLVALVGCSGSEGGGVKDDPSSNGFIANGDSSSDPDEPKAPAPRDSPTSNATTGGNADGGTGGGQSDAGASGSTDTSSGVTCAAGMPSETESNDTPGTANTIPAVTSSFCGRLTSTADVDYVTFTLPETVSSLAFGYAYDRAVLGVEVTVDSSTFQVGDAPIVKPGKTYLVKIWIKGTGTATNYRVGMTVTP